MVQKNYWMAILLLLISSFLSAQVTLHLTSVPANTPDQATLYVAGTFNDWQAGDGAFTLTTDTDGTYQITFSPAPGTLEFKFTRGSWETVEGDAAGNYRPNRTLAYNGQPLTVDLEILSWEDLGGGGGGGEGNVSILSNDFYMPQLDRYRRIWIYLPPDYESSNLTYPVLYMHDGQNLFDPATSFAGEWEVDESLDLLFDNGDDGVIVVGIDNGGSERINEYSPWLNPSYGGGQGDAYVNFIVETLKPHIDANYRTRPEREETGILGSSMGGLISLYAAVEHQDVFSKAGIFSPSLWFSDEAFAHVSATGKAEDMRFYLLAGESKGGGSVVDDLNALYNTFSNAGFSNDELFLITHPDGQHSEWYWSREFPDAYLWLFADPTSSASDAGAPAPVRLYPNPADTVLFLESTIPLENPRLQFFSMEGRAVGSMVYPRGNAVSLSFLSPGAYVVLIYEGGQVVGGQRIVKK